MNVYVSPHNDDVCFSLGALASQQGGELVSVFTVSDYVAAATPLPRDRSERIAAVTALRRREDESFAAAAGLDRHDLGLAEAPVRGRAPFDASSLERDVEDVGACLVPFLWTLLPAGSDPTTSSVYCPMGIGAHRDHLCVLAAVRRAFKILQRRCALYLYEDLHYASAPDVRGAGLARARRLFADAELTPCVVRLDSRAAALKLQWIALYASQHAHVPRSADYVPASGSEPEPHEMIWRVAPRPSAQA